MKTRTILTLCLLFESALILIGLLLRLDVWFGIVCYWTVVMLKNLLDLLDERNDHNRKGGAA